MGEEVVGGEEIGARVVGFLVGEEVVGADEVGEDVIGLLVGEDELGADVIGLFVGVAVVGDDVTGALVGLLDGASVGEEVYLYKHSYSWQHASSVSNKYPSGDCLKATG